MPTMPLAASSAMLMRRVQSSCAALLGESLAAFRTSFSEPREQKSDTTQGGVWKRGGVE